MYHLMDHQFSLRNFFWNQIGKLSKGKSLSSRIIQMKQIQSKISSKIKENLSIQIIDKDW